MAVLYRTFLGGVRGSNVSVTSPGWAMRACSRYPAEIAEI